MTLSGVATGSGEGSEQAPAALLTDISALPRCWLIRSSKPSSETAWLIYDFLCISGRSGHNQDINSDKFWKLLPSYLISAHFLRKELYKPWAQHVCVPWRCLVPHLHVRPSMPLLPATAVLHYINVSWDLENQCHPTNNPCSLDTGGSECPLQLRIIRRNAQMLSTRGPHLFAICGRAVTNRFWPNEFCLSGEPTFDTNVLGYSLQLTYRIY